VFVGTLGIFCGIFEWKEYEAFWIAAVPQTLGFIAGFGVLLLILFTGARKRWVGIVCLVVGLIVNGLMTVSMLEAARMNRNEARTDAWFREKSRQDQVMMESTMESLFKLRNDGDLEASDGTSALTNETEARTESSSQTP
jgi:hypothetical protein